MNCLSRFQCNSCEVPVLCATCLRICHERHATVPLPPGTISHCYCGASLHCKSIDVHAMMDASIEASVCTYRDTRSQGYEQIWSALL